MPEETRTTGPSPDPERVQEPPANSDKDPGEGVCEPGDPQDTGDDHSEYTTDPPEEEGSATATGEEETGEEEPLAPTDNGHGPAEELSPVEQDTSTKGSTPSTTPPADRKPLVVPVIKVMYNKNHLPTDIREDEYYYEWMEEILEAFPNKGPPCTPGRLSNHIYIGSLVNAEDEVHLKRLGITHVLNCAGTRRFDLEKSPYPKDVGIKEYRMIPAEDFEDYDIVKHFSTAFAFLDRCKNKGGKCLVHCNLGVNRSGAICAGYLMMTESRSLLQVIEQLKRVRQMVLTNRGFRYQLINYARMRNLLDPIIVESGLPATIPPPTGNSKFALGASAKREAKSKKNVGASDVPPASDFLNINGVASSTCHYGSSRDLPPRPSSACGMVDPPVSARSFTRSSSAMGVHRKPGRWSSWSDLDIDDYMDDTNDSPYRYESKSSYVKPKRPTSSPSVSSFSRPSTSLGFSNGLSYNSSSDSASKSFSLFRHKPVYSRTTPVSPTTYSKVDTSYDKPRNILNLLNKSRGLSGASNGLGPKVGYGSGDTPEPYHTFTMPTSSYGISYTMPQPPFGTSRRRFGPAKGLSFNY